MHSRFALLSTLAIVAAFTGPALAQAPAQPTPAQPTPAQAQSLEHQITDWLKNVTADAIPLPTRPVEMTAEGDHYLVRVPLGAFGKVQPADAAFTAKARLLDGTRWALDDERLPSDMTFTGSEMVPNPPDAKNPDADGTHAETTTYHVIIGQQDMHGVFDPTYAQPTTNGGTMASLDVQKTGGVSPSSTHTGPTHLPVEHAAGRRNAHRLPGGRDGRGLLDPHVAAGRRRRHHGGRAQHPHRGSAVRRRA